MNPDHSQQPGRDLGDEALGDAAPDDQAADDQAFGDVPPDEEAPDGIPGPDPEGEDADFASEHDDTTFADDTPGVPGGVRRRDSPRGRGGDGGMDP